jgi:hypothetical protein
MFAQATAHLANVELWGTDLELEVVFKEKAGTIENGNELDDESTNFRLDSTRRASGAPNFDPSSDTLGDPGRGVGRVAESCAA